MLLRREATIESIPQIPGVLFNSYRTRKGDASGVGCRIKSLGQYCFRRTIQSSLRDDQPYFKHVPGLESARLPSTAATRQSPGTETTHRQDSSMNDASKSS